MIKIEKDKIDLKKKKLEEVSSILKSEFYGIDATIDKIISSIQSWYIFPDLISRPVIVNLWGLTGTGKTHIVRRITELLDFNKKFIEVQMDGISGSSSYMNRTLSSLLRESSINEGEPGIILLDEFQRYRTVDAKGADVKVERFQDVWMLLSDGKFSGDSSMFEEIDMLMASAQYDNVVPEKTDEKTEKKKFSMYPYKAKRIKEMLRLTNSIADIMTWGPSELEINIENGIRNLKTFQFDYTKCLIFISGNLDEAYLQSEMVNDCDTDADVFYEYTKKISVMDIKTALKQRFKPEQISRLGNTHVIYPSLSKDAYKKIIHNTCFQYLDKTESLTGVKFFLDDKFEDAIYNNSVYPAQGSRPVFSSIHNILADNLTKVIFWAVENDFQDVILSIDSVKFLMMAKKNNKVLELPISLDIDLQKTKVDDNFIKTVSVHESGHALLYTLTTGKSPLEIKVNTASYKGGYMIPEIKDSLETKEILLDQICVLLAGKAAEQVVFGEDNTSNGCASDIKKATEIASSIVRKYGMGPGLGLELSQNPGYTPEGIIPLEISSRNIEDILREQFDRAIQLLNGNKDIFIRIVDALNSKRTFNSAEFDILVSEIIEDKSQSRSEQWDKYKSNNLLTNIVTDLKIITPTIVTRHVQT